MADVPAGATWPDGTLSARAIRDAWREIADHVGREPTHLVLPIGHPLRWCHNLRLALWAAAGSTPADPTTEHSTDEELPPWKRTSRPSSAPPAPRS